MKTQTEKYVIEFKRGPIGKYMEVRKGDEVLESGLVMTNVEHAILTMMLKHKLPDDTKVVVKND